MGYDKDRMGEGVKEKERLGDKDAESGSIEKYLEELGNKNRIILKWGCGGQREDLPQNENGKGEIVKREIDGEKI